MLFVGWVVCCFCLAVICLIVGALRFCFLVCGLLTLLVGFPIVYAGLLRYVLCVLVPLVVFCDSLIGCGWFGYFCFMLFWLVVALVISFLVGLIVLNFLWFIVGFL